MLKTGIYKALIFYCKIIIPVLFICQTVTYAQILGNRQVLFDDFKYSSIEYPIEGDSSGSIYGKNPWLTENGVIYTPAWKRYNRDYHNFGKNSSLSLEDFGFSLNMNSGFQRNTKGPVIVSGFYFTKGTFAAKIRFNKIKFDTQFIQAFWLSSPVSFKFIRGSETIRYWSEMDFEFNNFFKYYDIISVHAGCNNHNGTNPISAALDCICKEDSNYISFPNCNGYYKGKSIITGQWYVCMFNLDSVSRTIKFSMLCDSLTMSGAKIWAGNSSEPDSWGEAFIIRDYFPEYALTSIFSLHIGSKSEIALSNSKLDVDWFYYSPDTDLSFDEVQNDINILKSGNISRVNTTQSPTFPEGYSEELGVVYIEGPDSISTCESHKWKLKSNYRRHSNYEMDFRYRFIDDFGTEEWVSVYRPEITLTPRNYHKRLEIISSAYDYWGQYLTNDTILVHIISGEYDCNFQKFIVEEPYPNPALLTIQFDYELLERHQVNISIYDILGNKIELLENRYQNRGHYSVFFDASKYATGLYVSVFKLDNSIVCKTFEIYKGGY